MVQFLDLFTLLSREEIDAWAKAHAADPGSRQAHRALAHHATTLLHGQEQAQHAADAAKALFAGTVTTLPKAMLEEVLSEVPSSEHDKATLAGDGVELVAFLVEIGLAKSKREAREFLSNGSVRVNGSKADLETRLTTGDLLHDELIAIRRGKKAWHLTRW